MKCMYAIQYTINFKINVVQDQVNMAELERGKGGRERCFIGAAFSMAI